MPEKFVELGMGAHRLESRLSILSLGDGGRMGTLNSYVKIFTTLFEAQVLIENWRKDYNQNRPHIALAHRIPAPEAITPGYGSTSLTLNVVQ
jgi:transposase InsO family protein